MYQKPASEPRAAPVATPFAKENDQVQTEISQYGNAISIVVVSDVTAADPALMYVWLQESDGKGTMCCIIAGTKASAVAKAPPTTPDAMLPM